MEAYHILIVEDDKEILDGVGIYMKNQGYRVFKAQNGLEGLKVLEQEEIHLAIVDIMMPVMDGITMTMKLREHYDFPVIMLSAKSEEIDKVTGLNIGADDYVTKPFDLEILASRIRALLRRAGRRAGAEGDRERLRCGEILLDTGKKTAFIGEEEIVLSRPEYELLRILMENQGRTVTRALLLEQVWDSEGNFVNDNTLTVAMKRLREKLHHPACLKTVRSFGYRMED